MTFQVELLGLSPGLFSDYRHLALSSVLHCHLVTSVHPATTLCPAYHNGHFTPLADLCLDDELRISLTPFIFPFIFMDSMHLSFF